MARGEPVEAEVVGILPSAAYKLQLAGGSEVTAHLARPAETNFVRLRLRDRVLVELSASDPSRGRIVKVLSKS
jgi:translation initiation factor IF-1